MIPSQPIEPQIIDYLPQLDLGLQLECDPANYIDRLVLSHGSWEPLVISALSGLIKPGDVCVDVGANAGYISLVMGRYVGPSGRVISFEPNPDVIVKFRRNLSLNPELRQTVELRTVGLGKEATRMFVAPDTEVGIGNAGLASAASSHTTFQVEVATLDSFDLPRLDCMKVDVEGMELDVLRGAEATIRKFCPYIVFETLTVLPPEKHKPVEDFLRGLGYRIYCLNAQHARFDEVSYPRFPQDDTFAIHPRRVAEAAQSRR